MQGKLLRQRAEDHFIFVDYLCILYYLMIYVNECSATSSNNFYFFTTKTGFDQIYIKKEIQKINCSY